MWITNYLSSDAVGFSVPQASTIITSYGVVVALAAFLSGALCDALGCRKVMLIGLISFLIFDALFIPWACPATTCTSCCCSTVCGTSTTPCSPTGSSPGP